MNGLAPEYRSLANYCASRGWRVTSASFSARSAEHRMTLDGGPGRLVEVEGRTVLDLGRMAHAVIERVEREERQGAAS